MLVAVVVAAGVGGDTASSVAAAESSHYDDEDQHDSCPTKSRSRFRIVACHLHQLHPHLRCDFEQRHRHHRRVGGGGGGRRFYEVDSLNPPALHCYHLEKWKHQEMNEWT